MQEADTTNPQSEVTKPALTIPAEIRTLLGEPPLLISEDPSAYDALLATFAATVRPEDCIEWIYVKDCVDLNWEIRRIRQAKAGIIDVTRKEALRSILESILEEDDLEFSKGRISEAVSKPTNGTPALTSRRASLHCWRDTAWMRKRSPPRHLRCARASSRNWSTCSPPRNCGAARCCGKSAHTAMVFPGDYVAASRSWMRSSRWRRRAASEQPGCSRQRSRHGLGLPDSRQPQERSPQHRASHRGEQGMRLP